MLSATETKYYTPEEYLALEETSEDKNEYRQGEIIPMVGATIGAGIGIFIAFGRGKNMLLGALVGSVIGGAISRAFIVKK